MDTDRLAHTIATWFGCGHSPIAPGTVGSIGAVPVYLLLRACGPGATLFGAILASGIGVWASDRTARALGEKDPQQIVIDEVAGTLLALSLCSGRTLRTKVLAVALFRVLDVLKPGWIDKAQHAKPLGLGIMADDVLAGVLAGLALRLLSAR